MWRPANFVIAVCVAVLIGNVAMVSPAVAHPNEPSFSLVDPVNDHGTVPTGHHCLYGASCTFLNLSDGSIRTRSESAPYFRTARSDAHAGLCVPPAAPPPKFTA